MCDIPPALYLSKSYLEKCFPDKKSIYLPSGTSKVDAEMLIKDHDLIFVLPDMLHVD